MTHLSGVHDVVGRAAEGVEGEGGAALGLGKEAARERKRARVLAHGALAVRGVSGPHAAPPSAIRVGDARRMRSVWRRGVRRRIG